MCELECLRNPVAVVSRITVHCSFDLRVDVLGVTLLVFSICIGCIVVLRVYVFCLFSL